MCSYLYPGGDLLLSHDNLLVISPRLRRAEDSSCPPSLEGFFPLVLWIVPNPDCALARVAAEKYSFFV